MRRRVERRGKLAAELRRADQARERTMSDLVVRNARLMTCDPSRPGIGIIDPGAIAVVDGKIKWIGEDDARPRGTRRLVDAGGRLVTPGLVDCHTHAIFAG